ncbi:hypothetical protein C1646_708806 [Rhizophagus diaphanus]|nr:hypothetical protein C1646_708806 [Rhizophagus diaphanus] [Rhizophagus sp. MUCL 43196]
MNSAASTSTLTIGHLPSKQMTILPTLTASSVKTTSPTQLITSNLVSPPTYINLFTHVNDVYATMQPKYEY